MPESTAPSNSTILIRSTSTAVTTPRDRHFRWSKFTPWLGASKILGFPRNIWPCLWFISGFGDCFFCVPLFEPTSILSVASTMFYHVPYWLYTHWLWIISSTISGWWYTYPSEKSWSSSVGMMKFPTEWKVIKFHGSKPPTRISSISSLLWYHVIISATPKTPSFGEDSSKVGSSLGTKWDDTVLILQNDLEMWFNYGFIQEMILVLILVSKWGLINFVSY